MKVENYNFDFRALSRDNVYFILALYKYKDCIKEKNVLGRKKLAISSMVYDSAKAFKIAIEFITREIFINKIVNKVNRVIDKFSISDIILTKVENQGNGNDRDFYRQRCKMIKNFGYGLVQQGLNNKRCEEIRRIFFDFVDVSREMQNHEIRNKIGVNNYEKS